MGEVLVGKMAIQLPKRKKSNIWGFFILRSCLLTHTDGQVGTGIRRDGARCRKRSADGKNQRFIEQIMPFHPPLAPNKSDVSHPGTLSNIDQQMVARQGVLLGSV